MKDEVSLSGQVLYTLRWALACVTVALCAMIVKGPGPGVQVNWTEERHLHAHNEGMNSVTYAGPETWSTYTFKADPNTGFGHESFGEVVIGRSCDPDSHTYVEVAKQRVCTWCGDVTTR